MYKPNQPLKQQLAGMGESPASFKKFLDEYIVETLHRHTERDIRLLSNLKLNSDTNYKMFVDKEVQKRSTEKMKKIIERL
jgi:hypothetical protein